MWGSVGITYNVDMVKERLPDADLESLDMIFKPENAAKLADCGISILDSPTDIMLMVLQLSRQGRRHGGRRRLSRPWSRPSSRSASTSRTFDNTNYLNAIPNKELCVINNWSGDYATAKARAAEAGVEINLAYFVPEDRRAGLGRLHVHSRRCAKHKDNAYKFLDYHAAARSDRQVHQLHQLCQWQRWRRSRSSIRRFSATRRSIPTTRR